MEQLHRRLTGEKVLLRGYCQRMLDRATVEEVLEIGRSRFFALLKEYRHDPDRFSIAYQRESLTIDSCPGREGYRKEIDAGQKLDDDPTLPITTYNYSAIRDRLAERGIRVALSTIIDRAKGFGYQPQQSSNY